MWNSCLLHESDTGVILVHCSQQRGLRMSLYLVIGRCMMSVLERGSQGLLLSLRLSPADSPSHVSTGEQTHTSTALSPQPLASVLSPACSQRQVIPLLSLRLLLTASLR